MIHEVNTRDLLVILLILFLCAVSQGPRIPNFQEQGSSNDNNVCAQNARQRPPPKNHHLIEAGGEGFKGPGSRGRNGAQSGYSNNEISRKSSVRKAWELNRGAKQKTTYTNRNELTTRRARLVAFSERGVLLSSSVRTLRIITVSLFPTVYCGEEKCILTGLANTES